MKSDATALAPRPEYASVTSDRLGSSLERSYLKPLSIGQAGACAASAVMLLVSATAEGHAPKAWTDYESPTREQIKFGRASYPAVTRKQDAKDVLIQRIRELGAFEAGWYNDHSQPASSKAIEEAERFVRSIDWSAYISPIVALAEDGELNLVWSDEKRHVDIGFIGDGTYAFFARGTGNASYHDDGAPFNSSLPSEVMALLAIEEFD